MSEPDETGQPSRWRGEAKWYLWDGGFFAVGRTHGVVPPHSHHAIQIVVAVDGEIGVKGAEGGWRFGPGLIIQADVEHSYDAGGALGGMVLLDPESNEGTWLCTSLRQPITLVPNARLEAPQAELRAFIDRPFDSMEVGVLIRHCVHSLCTGAPPARKLDPRVTTVLKAIRASDDLRFSAEDAAAMIFLSPSRFAHLFKQQVGLPFRRYMLWRKLTRATLAIGRERTIAAAAHAADFADAAHLTRTFYQMFGLPPSVMMRGEFFEIASPFEPAASL